MLRVFDLHKSYKMGKAGSLHVLKGINLQVREGEIIAIVGPSGVGKSTLLHLIGGLDWPTKGRVEIDGKDMFRYDNEKLSKLRNQTVGFVFQFHHLLPEFTALENVMMPGLIGRLDNKQLKKRCLTLLEEVGLADRLNHRPGELSGGEQQRLAVARALTNNPRLLLADEPSGNLDVHTANSLHRLLWQLNKKYNQTLIIVTHNKELAEQADKIIELYDGNIKNYTRNH
ncbi:MAG: ATP-binding cassette domain-containing protein [Actinobacteria bacterium]|nr:ATP-binding cassette domain-containing protein [Actinomycetota bacterium]